MIVIAFALAALAFATALTIAMFYLRDRKIKKLLAADDARRARKMRLDYIEDSLTTISTREWR